MRWTIGILCLFGFNSPQALGVETVGLSGLQTGPIGNGYVFEPIELLSEEVYLTSTSITGKERSVGQTLNFKGETLNLSLGTGLKATQTISVLLKLEAEKETLRGEGGSQKITHKTTSSELRIGPNIWLGDLLIGAEVSALFLGKDSLSSEDSAAKTTINTGAVTIPRLRLFTGIKSGTVSAMVRSLLYNHGNATRTTNTPTAVLKRDVKRRIPAETSIDTRIAFDPLFSLAGSVTFVDAERASDDNKNNYLIYGIGGLYRTSSDLSFASSMHYTDPNYKRGSDASIIDDNLGGLRLNVGTRYSWNASAMSLDAGYTLPEPAEYQTDQSRNVVKLERSKWTLALGLKSSW